MTSPTFSPVLASDFEGLVALRIEALRESLERLGRFDPVRARERLAAGFAPHCMQHIEMSAKRIGFITLRPDPASGAPALHLDHLYIRPAWQGQGIGAWALNWAKLQAVQKNCGISLSALKQSAANRFYVRHGFVQVGESSFDLDYRWDSVAAE